MLSEGQKIFAILFVIAFLAVMVWSYRKDITLHKIYYKNTYIVIIGILVVIGLFTAITFSMH